LNYIIYPGKLSYFQIPYLINTSNGSVTPCRPFIHVLQNSSNPFGNILDADGKTIGAAIHQFDYIAKLKKTNLIKFGLKENIL
jgi:hypothetical protein